MTKDIERLNALCRKSFYAFLRKMYPVYNGSNPLKDNWHIQRMARDFQRCAEGDCKRFLCTLPPRNLKSYCASIAFPVWLLGCNPSQRIICVSYNDDLAVELSLHRRKLMESEEYQRIFPNVSLSGKNTESVITTSNGGKCIATSVNGTLTGRGGNFIIIDDPIKPVGAMSEAELKKVNDWYGHTLFSRLDDKENGVIALIMQRLHQDDLAGHVLKSGNWEHLNLPAISTADVKIQIDDDKWYEWHKGEALHPAFESLEHLEETKANLGSYHFSAQYQQDPAPALGGIIKEEYFSFYDERPTKEIDDCIVHSIDPASTLTTDSSYSVILTFLVKGNRYYLIDHYRDRVIPHTLKLEILNRLRRWPGSIALIENVGIGTGIYADLKHHFSGRPETIIGIKVAPGDNKVIRMESQLQNFIERRIFFPRNAPYLTTLKDELLMFPNGKHDDQVDSLSQFLKSVETLPPCSGRNRRHGRDLGHKFTLRDAHKVNPMAAKDLAWKVRRR